MQLTSLRQILKGFGDDTRIRILNLLTCKELTVKEICSTLEKNQPSISKHLIKLRLLRIVDDKRVGNFTYYSINLNSYQEKIVRFIFSEFSSDVEILKNDLEKLNKIEKKETNVFY